ncbi:unnamed protein product, partial [marine sediment metagenome]
GLLGVPQLTKAITTAPETALRFFTPVMRTADGYRVELELPDGVTADDVVTKRETLASNLKRNLGQVWPSHDAGKHPGRLVLFVADQELADRPQRWPLASRGSTNLFEPQVIGVSAQGDPVSVTLMFESFLVGAVPRMGKTAFLRILALVSVLDKRAEVHIFDLKGGSDFLALEPVANVITGDLADEEDDVLERSLAVLSKLQVEQRRRYRLMKTLDRSLAPDAKVTSDLADMADMGLHPIVLIVDECHEWFEHPD